MVRGVEKRRRRRQLQEHRRFRRRYREAAVRTDRERKRGARQIRSCGRNPRETPQTGLEGKFSIYHAVAVALVEDADGERQFSDRAVNDPTVIALRSKVIPVFGLELVRRRSI